MENNLYYTPTIEEFHVGFEYEHLTGFEKEFKFYIYDLAKACLIIERESISHNGEIVKMFIPAIQACIEEKQCRVKYLDQSDIESLGLTGFEITEYVEGSHLEFTWFKGIELFGLLTFTDKMISFYEYNYSTREYSDCIFRGTIKNKSELIKLMQQLNIK